MRQETGDILRGESAAHSYFNRTVGECVLEVADLSDCFRAEHIEHPRLEVVAHRAKHGFSAAVARIEYPAQFVVGLKERIRLVYEKRRAASLHGPEHDGGGKVRSTERPWYQRAQQMENGRFAA